MRSGFVGLTSRPSPAIEIFGKISNQIAPPGCLSPGASLRVAKRPCCVVGHGRPSPDTRGRTGWQIWIRPPQLGFFLHFFQALITPAIQVSAWPNFSPDHPCNSRINNASTKRFRPTPQKRPPRNSLSRKGFRDHGARLRTYSLLTPSEMTEMPPMVLVVSHGPISPY